jgi:hypothetical protein
LRLLGGPQQPLFDELRDAAGRHPGCRLQVAVAWVNQEGAALLKDATSSVGSLDAVVGINNKGTTVEGMLAMHSLAGSLRVLYQHPFVTFHPKAYWFDAGDAGTLIVGSSNLTGGGLDSNFEASIAADLSPELRQQWQGYWQSLEGHKFCFKVDSEEAIEELYLRGHLISEGAARRRRRGSATPAAKAGPGEDAPAPLPTKPPSRRFRPVRSTVEVPFDLEPAEEEAGEAEAPPKAVPDPGVPDDVPLLFVRTLTSNDVAKLHGEQRGTLEPDLTLGARDQNPGFWGWPGQFRRVVHTLPRDQRTTQSRLFSNKTGALGAPIELVIWFREERPGHAAEFRFRPGGLKGNKALVPDEFDEDSLVVFEPAGNDYNLLLVTQADARYSEYAALLTTKRPAHRYGYGSLP